MNAWVGFDNTGTWTATAPIDAYHENTSYDATGNILTYLRNGSATQTAMDNLTYNYLNNADGSRSNRLGFVDDAISSTNYPLTNNATADIDDQTTGNYQ